MLYQQFINKCEFFIMLLELFVEGKKKAIYPVLISHLSLDDKPGKQHEESTFTF